MKVEKYITVETTVEVDVSVDDITAAILSEMSQEAQTDREIVFEVNRGLNRGLQFVKAVPDDAIRKLPRGARAVYVQVMREEADRYAAIANVPASPDPCKS
jgi:hypothetical protein